MIEVEKQGRGAGLKRVKPSSPKPKGKAFGLMGLGVISLCGIACSLPLLLGGLAIGSAAVWSFLSLTWPIALGLLAFVTGLGWFIIARKNNQSPTGTIGCSSDSACGCKDMG